MKSSSDRWIIQTYPPIHYFRYEQMNRIGEDRLLKDLGQDVDGWFCLKFYRPLDHDFSMTNPSVWKTIEGAIKRVTRELERGGLNPKWFYRLKNLETNEIIPYDIL